MTYLLSFISGYIWRMASTLGIESLAIFSKEIPTTVSRARSVIELKEDRFIVFSSCPSCDTVYEVAKCIDERGSCKQSKTCNRIEFPNHPHKSARNECGSVLMKTCRSPSGSTFRYPICPFCYQPISKALQTIIYRIKPSIGIVVLMLMVF